MKLNLNIFNSTSAIIKEVLKMYGFTKQSIYMHFLCMLNYIFFNSKVIFYENFVKQITYGSLKTDCASPSNRRFPPAPLQAVDSRDSMAMALYSQCFNWIIRKLNNRIRGREDFKSISILDIFGFENFEVCLDEWKYSPLSALLNTHCIHETYKVKPKKADN